jgi:uncharacterized protein YceK
MSKVLLALTSAALLALSGCAEVQTKPADKPAAVVKPATSKPAEAAKPTISAEAQATLAAAQADVKAAKAKNALWTTAQDALEAAEAAAAKGDSATVLSQSRLASDHVRKGLAQLDYPMLKIGN